MANSAGGDASAAGHVSDVVGSFARRQVPAGAERRIPPSDHQRFGCRWDEGDREGSVGGWLAWAHAFSRWDARIRRRGIEVLHLRIFVFTRWAIEAHARTRGDA